MDTMTTAGAGLLGLGAALMLTGTARGPWLLLRAGMVFIVAGAALVLADAWIMP